MRLSFLRQIKFWRRLVVAVISISILFFSIVLLLIYLKQDTLIQSEVDALNKGYHGEIRIGDTHIEPFATFPFISIKIDNVIILESKDEKASELLNVTDIYVGFNIWDILQGNYDIQNLLIEDGFFNIIFHKDGTINIQNALEINEAASAGPPIEIHLKNIELLNLDIHKFDEATNVDIETFIYSAKGSFQAATDVINAHVDSKFELNVIENGDSTYINHKQFEFHTDLSLNDQTGLLVLKPSDIRMEHGDFEIEGSINLKNDVDLALELKGAKRNFDMLIAFAPQDLITLLKRYKNEGEIYFNASVNGPTLHGVMPFIDVKFGASKAFLENTRENKRIDEMGFEGHFTNGKERSLKTMEFSLTGMTAKLETGRFLGSVFVKNFENPEVDMQLSADFNVAFLTRFLSLEGVEAEGNAELEMKFHDIIDLKNPEFALKNLNQAYFGELNVQNLSLRSSDLPVPLEKLDMHLIMKGEKADLDLFEMNFGNSDISIKGYISDLPSIVHHTNIPVVAHLEIASKTLDISEITSYSKTDSSGIDEFIEGLNLGLTLKSSAKAFTEYEHLPVGEYFIDNLHAQLKHYPHELHDFHADIMVGNDDIRIKDFTGYIDDSDFHFNGFTHDYSFWIKDTPDGDIDLDLSLNSDRLRLEDIFSYGGENYVPEEYRHEEVSRLKLHLQSSMHYRASALHSIDVHLDKLNAKMHLHPMSFEDFRGRIHYEDEHFLIEKFHGKIGRTVFDFDMNYYLGKNSAIRKRDNHLDLKASYIDFDQLFNFNIKPMTPGPESIKTPPLYDVSDHSKAFNLYELPFTDMTIDLDVARFIYHRIDLQKIHTRIRTTENHYLYLDTLDLNVAGGNIRMSGYFNGSDPKQIYFKPNLKFKKVELDKLLFKFEKLGQDVALSENIHGKISADITGKIRVYPDMVPDMDQSEIHIDLQVLDGRLENYDYMLMLSDYLGDKDLKSVRFDTLENHMDIINGELNIPNMSIESTLGHFELSGKQDTDLNMEYFIKIPWSLIKQAARYKIFGEKKTAENQMGDDEIIQVSPNKKTKYLNLKVRGNRDNYNVTLGKAKKRNQ